jgi:hypothetical protein
MPAPSYWHEPNASHGDDQKRQVAGDEQKRQLETFAAANGFLANTPVIVLGGGGGAMAPPAAGAPAGN